MHIAYEHVYTVYSISANTQAPLGTSLYPILVRVPHLRRVLHQVSDCPGVNTSLVITVPTLSRNNKGHYDPKFA